ncbi:hypothetical protein DYB25_000760 [Aphanomyces astaci]|uniref:HAT C-terminal dimerisation domain-containing protein n=1 Tax=Aphanomyces astaci TaxID=112090 RepID=A0A397C6I5_APHAT|nr:hypothetical protein DYB25_000760 [Aphanomyces astaci]
MADHVANLKAAIFANLNGLDGQMLQFEVKANPVLKKSECWRKFGHVHALQGGLVQLEDTSFVACFACHTVYTFKSKNGTSTIMGHKCPHERATSDNNDGGKKDPPTLRKPKNPELDTLKREITKALVDMDVEKGFTLHSNPVATKSDCWKRFGHVYQHGAPFEAFESTYVACFHCKVVYQYKVRNGTSTMTTHACATASSPSSFGGHHPMLVDTTPRKPTTHHANPGMKRSATEFLHGGPNSTIASSQPRQNSKRVFHGTSSSPDSDVTSSQLFLTNYHHHAVTSSSSSMHPTMLPPKKAMDMLKQSITASLLAAAADGSPSSPYDLRPNVGDSKAECWSRFGFVYRHNTLLMEGGAYLVGCYECKAVYMFKTKNGTSSLLSHVCAMRKALDVAKARVSADLLHLVTHDILPVDVVDGAGFRRLCHTLMQVGARHPSSISQWTMPDTHQVQAQLVRRFALAKAALVDRLVHGHVAVTCTHWRAAAAVVHDGTPPRSHVPQYNNKLMVALSIHFIDADFALHHRLLDVHEDVRPPHGATSTSTTTDTSTSTTSTTGDGPGKAAAVAAAHESVKNVPLATKTLQSLAQQSLADVGQPTAVLVVEQLLDPQDKAETNLLPYQTFASVELDAILCDLVEGVGDPVLAAAVDLMGAMTWQALVRALEALRTQWDQSPTTSDKAGRCVRQWLAFCTPFGTAMETFQTTEPTQPTVHTVCYWRHVLRQHCRRPCADAAVSKGHEDANEEEEEDAAVVGAAKAAALRRLQQWTLSPAQILAALLDPRQRKRVIKFGVSVDEITLAKDTLRLQMIELAPLVKLKAINISYQSEKTPMMAASILSMYGGDSDDEEEVVVGDDNEGGGEPNDSVSIADRVECEMAKYFDGSNATIAPVTPDKATSHDAANPLGWWRRQAPRYPLLSRAARSVLCVPAAPKQIHPMVQKHRHLLSTHAREILFVQANQDLLGLAASPLNDGCVI